MRLFVMASINNVPCSDVTISEDVCPADVDERVINMQIEAYLRHIPMRVEREYVKGELRTVSIMSCAKKIDIHIY